MRYAKIVFDTKELMQDAPRKELAAAGRGVRNRPGAGRGAVCQRGSGGCRRRLRRPVFPARWPFGRAFPPATPAPRTTCARPMNWSTLLTRREDVYDGLEWMQTAVEMQFIAQAGLAYSKDPYDLERFGRLRELAAEMLARGSGLPIKTVRDVFLCETGYQTPKIDTRAAIVEDGRILLVQENTGLWALPGGWMDVDTTISQNTAKEAFEEAGLQVLPRRLIALQEHNLHNPPTLAIGIVKVFVLCERLSGDIPGQHRNRCAAAFSPRRNFRRWRRARPPRRRCACALPRRRMKTGSRCSTKGARRCLR